ncbi:MAG TPA: hypothetical protein VI306_08560 [Pyrinomonadaceae bacterium]
MKSIGPARRKKVETRAGLIAEEMTKGTPAGSEAHASANGKGSRHQPGRLVTAGKVSDPFAFHTKDERRGDGRQLFPSC